MRGKERMPKLLMVSSRSSSSLGAENGERKANLKELASRIASLVEKDAGLGDEGGGGRRGKGRFEFRFRLKNKNTRRRISKSNRAQPTDIRAIVSGEREAVEIEDEGEEIEVGVLGDDVGVDEGLEERAAELGEDAGVSVTVEIAAAADFGGDAIVMEAPLSEKGTLTEPPEATTK